MRRTRVWTAYELLMIDTLAGAYTALARAIEASNAMDPTDGESAEEYEARVRPETDATEAAAAVYARAVDALLRHAEVHQREPPWPAFHAEVSGFVLADLVDDSTGKLALPGDLLEAYFIDPETYAPADMMGVSIAFDTRAIALVMLGAVGGRGTGSGGAGGIGYWCSLIDVEAPAAADLKLHIGPSVVPVVDYPLSQGGALLLHESEPSGAPGPRRIDRTAIERALRIMAAKYATTFARIVEGTHDARTGDILLQLAAFDRLVYG